MINLKNVIKVAGVFSVSFHKSLTAVPGLESASGWSLVFPLNCGSRGLMSLLQKG